MNTEQTWFNVTTWADRDWQNALAGYWTAYARVYNDPARLAALDKRLAWSRADYRQRVLSWYRKLCLPMQITECVPDEVALLLAEEWDEATAWRAS